MERDKDSVMWQLVSGDISRVSGRTAFDAMRKGDATATYVVGGYLRSVSIGIADIINMLQPEVLCIGGGISNEGDTLLMPVKKMVAKEVFTSHSNSTTDIRIAMLGNDAGIIGAALLK